MLPNRLVPRSLVVTSRINGKWYELSFSPGVEPPFAHALCVSVLHELVIRVVAIVFTVSIMPVMTEFVQSTCEMRWLVRME